jgi:AcrR family transcriptional regulator
MVMADSTTGRNDRSRIVDVALRLLDEHGLADLTMRRLAAELDVRASALYWHFENKQTLLAAVADRIVAAAETGPDADPTVVARALRDALLAHRDGAEVVISTQALALGADQAHERLRVALSPSHGEAASRRAAAVLLQFTLGHASLVQQRLQAVRLGVVDLSPQEVASSAETDFEAGVRMLVAGVGAL